MDKETLERAKQLEEDIQKMEFALSYYKQGRWSNWDTLDNASSFHFAFCKNCIHVDRNMQNLPTWLNGPLMEVVERELERCKYELETLGSEEQKTDTVDEIKTCTVDDVKEAAKRFALSTVEHKETWTDGVDETLKRMLSWALYSMLFCFLFGVAGLELSVRENVAYALMLGLVVSSINNIEQGMRELFKREG